MNEAAQDLASLRATTMAVVRAAWAGARKDLQQARPQSDLARQRLKEAFSGLDSALAQFALASKLAIDEAGSRATQASREECARFREEMEHLEAMFLDTLQESAVAAHDGAGGILKDLADHFRTHGSAVGAQAKETLAALQRLAGATGHASADAGAHLAQSAFNHLRQLSAGALAGLADHLRPKR